MRTRPGKPRAVLPLTSPRGPHNMRQSNDAGRSAAWLARLPWEQEVTGSNPVAPILVGSRGGRRQPVELLESLDEGRVVRRAGRYRIPQVSRGPRRGRSGR